MVLKDMKYNDFKSRGIVIFILLFIFSCNPSPSNSETVPNINDGFQSPKKYEGMQLIWSDEFQTDSLDEKNWTYEIGNGNWGWGNNEKEYYQKENTSILDKEYLVIEAREEEVEEFKYTSSRLVTKEKQEFKFGRFDIRAKLPQGQGIWPALWMLGANFKEVGWPACGEMDIMELVGHKPNEIHSTIHYGAEPKLHQYHGKDKVTQDSSNYSEQFHVFSLLWEKDTIQFLMDDELVYASGANSMKYGQPYPFNQEFFFIFNVAVGGNWPGNPDSTTIFPQQMIVDYVRVFQKDIED